MSKGIKGFQKGNVGYWKGKKNLYISGEKNPQWKGGISRDINKYKKERRHRLGISKRYIFKYGGPKPLSQREHRLLRKYNMKNAGPLIIQTIQRVYEDNIKRFGTLTCYLCLNPIEFGKDHLELKIPLSRGGTNAYENLAIACQRCNCKKHNKTEEEYRKEKIKWESESWQ